MSNIEYAIAQCESNDKDWPTKPCFNVEDPTMEETKQLYEEYYMFKGKQWMENKKIEMDNAIENKTLNLWLDQDIENNFQNHNVYMYYYTQGLAPGLSYDNTTSEAGDLYRRAQWYTSPSGVLMIGGLGAAAIIGSLYLFKKSKQR